MLTAMNTTMDTMIMLIMEMPAVHLLLLPRELNVRELKVVPQASEMLLELPQDLMERDVLTRLRWLRKLNMMMLSSVTIVMIRDVTPPMLQTMSLNKRRNVRKTSERTVSLNMKQLLSMKLSRSVELHLSRIVMFRDLRSVELNMSLSAGPNKWFMMLRMMLLLVKLRLRKSVRMRLLDILPTPSAPSGQRRSAVFPKRMSRSTPQSLDVPRNQESSVPQLVVDSSKELRSVMTKPRLLFRMPPRNSVLLSPRELASMSPNLFQS